MNIPAIQIPDQLICSAERAATAFNEPTVKAAVADCATGDGCGSETARLCMRFNTTDEDTHVHGHNA